MTASQQNNPRSEIVSRISEISYQLVGAWSSYKALDHLLHIKETSDVDQFYGEFIQETITAHAVRFINSVFNVLDKNEKSSERRPSIYRLIEVIEEAPVPIPGLNTTTIRDRIKHHSKTISRLTITRHN